MQALIALLIFDSFANRCRNLKVNYSMRYLFSQFRFRLQIYLVQSKHVKHYTDICFNIITHVRINILTPFYV